MRRGKQIVTLAVTAALLVTSIPLEPVNALAKEVTQEKTPMRIVMDEPLSEGALTGGSGHFTEAGSSTDYWQQLSLPIGNSYMGANIYGEIDKEHLTFNNKKLWTGGPTEERAYTGGNIDNVDGQPMADYLKDVQNAFLTGDSNASGMCDSLVGSLTSEYGSYQSWGDVYLDFNRDYLYQPEAADGVISDTSSRIRYGQEWNSYPKDSWEGGSEHFSEVAGAKFSVSFYGTGIQMIGVKGADMGDYEITVDGGEAQTGTLYSEHREEGQILFEVSGLENKRHTLTFKSAENEHGQKTSFDYLKVLRQETIIDLNPGESVEGVTYEGNWQSYDRKDEHDVNDWFGRNECFIEWSDAEGAKLNFTFTGTEVELLGAASEQLGSFSYQIDEGELTEVNTRENQYRRKSLISIQGLKSGEHTLTIFGMEGNKLSFDGFIVREGEENQKPPVHTEATNYQRTLEVDSSLATVEFDRDNTHYYREYLASYPDNVIAMKLTADQLNPEANNEEKNGLLEFEISFPVDQPEKDSDTIGKEAVYTVTEDTITVSGHLRDNEMQFNGQLKVVLGEGGGSVEALDEEEGTLLVSGAKEVTIFLTGDTDYTNDYPVYRTGDSKEQLAEKVQAVMDKAVGKGYEQVKIDAVADYQTIYNRVNLDLGQTEPNEATDHLLEKYKAGSASMEERRYLEALMFQYGRYLQIASSREGDELPANLQGVWLDHSGAANDPVPWGSDYHLNVNLQMNYWPTYVTNMSECAKPMINFMDSLREPGRNTAQMYYGIDNTDGKQNGYTANTSVTPFGYTAPGWDFSWGWSPASVPWMLQNVYEYYEYTGDIQFLKDKIFPMMEEEAKFYESILKEIEDADGTKRYVTIPAYSPEHGPYTAGNTYENTLVWQLFNDCIEAANKLNEDSPGTVSEDKIVTWNKFKEGLKPIEIGSDGQIKEWYDETGLGQTAAGGIGGYEAKHRHISQLLGLYPGDLITGDNKEYMNAAKVSLNARGDEATGWGIAQRLNAWARTGDGERTYQVIDKFFRTGVYSNMWDAHAPFQIDGNFGYTSGVAEMLVQSNEGYIHLLPALPEDTWSQGSVSGLVARGNFEVSEDWAEGTLTQASILSKNGGSCTVQYENWQKVQVTDQDGNVIDTAPVQEKAGRVQFDTEAGKTYYINQEEVETPDITLEDLQNNDYLIYLENCGTPDNQVIPEGHNLGVLQSNVEQAFGEDQKTGMEWGYAKADANSKIEMQGADPTDLTATIGYLSENISFDKEKSGLVYRFQVPDQIKGISKDYQVTLGFKNPWSARTVDIRLEDTDVAKDIDLTKDTLIEKTYVQTVTDGMLDVKVYSPNRTNQYGDPLISYIKVKALPEFTWNMLKERLDEMAALMEGKTYGEDCQNKFDQAQEAAKKLIDNNSQDLAAVAEAYRMLENAFAQLEERTVYSSITGTNGDNMYDTNGKQIQAHGGQIQKLTIDGKDKWYWIGEDKTNDYRPVGGIHLYSSDDMYNWKDEGVVLKTMETKEEFQTDPYFADLYGDYSEEEKEKIFIDLDKNNCVIERPKMLYNEKTGKYVIWFHADGRYPGSDADYGKAKAGIAIADNVAGPYKLLGSYKLNYSDGGDVDHGYDSDRSAWGSVRDMNLFKDEDGTGYIIYSSDGNKTTFISKLNEEYTFLAKDPDEAVEGVDFTRNFINWSREAPAMFKYDQMYYMITSGCTGWSPNPAEYMVAENPMGPWTSKGDPCEGQDAHTTFYTQSTCVVPVDPENGEFMYMGDRWNAGNLSDSRYVWIPIEFQPGNNLKMKPLGDWTLEDLKGKGNFEIVSELPMNVGSLEELRGELPEELVVSFGTEEVTTPVEWREIEGQEGKIGLVTLTGTLTEYGRTFTHRVFITNEKTVYFFDSAADTSAYFENAKNVLGEQLRNDQADQKYTNENGAGYTGISVREDENNYDYGIHYGGNLLEQGWYATGNKNIEYQFNLEPGEYTVSTGYQEWWDSDRAMKITVASEQEELAVQNFTLWKYDKDHQENLRFTVPNGKNQKIKVRISKTGNSDPVLSWIAVMQESKTDPEIPADKTALLAKIAEMEAVDLTGFTKDSADNFKLVLEEAKALAEKDLTMGQQQEITGMIEKLNKAYKDLEEEPVKSADKTALLAKIAEMETVNLTGFTKESADNFKLLLEEAKVLAEKELTIDQQQEVNDMIGKLDEAYRALEEEPVKLADKTALLAKIAEMEVVNLSGFTKESVEKFKLVLKEAKALAEKELTIDQQQQITDMIARLDGAYKELQKVVPVQPTEKPTVKPTEKPTEKPTVDPIQKPLGRPVLKVQSLGYKSIGLSWKKVDQASGYVVYRKYKNKSWKEYKRVVGKTYFHDKKVETGRSYEYGVKAYRTVGSKTVFSAMSKSVSGKAIPSKPVVTAKAYGKGMNKISWKKTAGVQQFVVYRKSTSKKARWEKLAVVKGNKLSYIDKKARKGKSYYYGVRGYRKVAGKNCYSEYGIGKKVSTRK